ncbi:Claudin-23 [Dissostichus eleginoides]|uniref:Claudin n=1 Tax=Dissostichus eleginoides TaxID=100907 RepID=A0AAD9C4H5_DISEL|nr:Claudin-23 [Dissostichus eleginoides]
MHTPASMVMGIVFAPLGLVLVFTAAITPQWRQGQARLGMTGFKGQGVGVRSGAVEALLLLCSDGLWESCLQVEHSELKQCWPVAGPYQRDPRVRLAQGLILSSLFLCGTGIVLACIGVRCWTDIPMRGVAATGGLLVVTAGLLSLTALGVYTHNLARLGIAFPSGGRHCSDVQLQTSKISHLPGLPGADRCPACRSCPEITKHDTEVYEVSC